MSLRKPLKLTTTYLLNPLWDSFEKDELAENAIFDHFEKLLSEIDGLELDTADMTEPSFPGRLVFHVEKLRESDLKIVEAEDRYARLSQVGAIPLRVYAEWPEPNEIAQYNKSRGVRFNRSVVKRSCGSLVNAICLKVLVLMNCYLPGSSRCLFYYNNHDNYARLGCVNSFSDAALHLFKGGIAPLERSSMVDLIKWSQSLDGFWTGLPEINIGKALNFFSHADHPTHQLNTLADLTWIIGALESLLSDTTQEIRSKMARRAALVSPDIVRFVSKRQLGQLYDFRSKFLHGAISLPNQFTLEWAQKEWYGFQFTDAFSLASAVLISLINRSAKEGWIELKFDDQVVGR